MKKSHKIIISILISLLVIIIILAALGIGTFFSLKNNDNKPLFDISEMIGIEILDEDMNMINHIETHGGFHGDGTTFYSMEITSNDTVDEIKSEWKELPLTENLTALVYGLEDETSSIGPYISEDGEALFPKVENGYYYFYDRHSESKDHFDDTNVLARPSFNFVIAIFDTDTNRLYYSKFDT